MNCSTSWEMSREVVNDGTATHARGARTQAHENDRIELAVFDRQAGVGDPRPHDCLPAVIIRVGGGRRPPRGGEAPAFYFRNSPSCARRAPKRMKTESSGNGVGPGRRPGPLRPAPVAMSCTPLIHPIFGTAASPARGAYQAHENLDPVVVGEALWNATPRCRFGA